MRKVVIILIGIAILACKNQENNSEGNNSEPPKEQIQIAYEPIVLTLEQANNLAKLPLKCIQQEYPNKLGQTIGGGDDLQSPKTLHPTFYGCFDWHSAVHGHWSLVSLLKQFPNLDKAEEIKTKLRTNISPENIQKEIEYFHGKHNKSYERTYGWAWLLKLAEELNTWDNSFARELETNLQPLTDLIVTKYIEFLPKLNYPIRVGEHTNTAFGLAFPWDYANTLNHSELKSMIEKRAKDFYMRDQGCPLTWEPSGFDFLSPCLEEAEIMSRILSKEEFTVWFDSFLPQVKDQGFSFEVGKVSDRSDGKLVHLDGVNFSRAWALFAITNKLEGYDHLKVMAKNHIEYSLPNLVGDAYEGGHWLGSFAIYALNSGTND
ncbi:MAG: DUF2891 domain-containing protein [Flavobacteriaceae bacterium]|nr:DUF2891 domain-containing protein [Flavobacteriaceae bacterium]